MSQRITTIIKQLSQLEDQMQQQIERTKLLTEQCKEGQLDLEQLNAHALAVHSNYTFFERIVVECQANEVEVPDDSIMALRHCFATAMCAADTCVSQVEEFEIFDASMSWERLVPIITYLELAAQYAEVWSKFYV